MDQEAVIVTKGTKMADPAILHCPSCNKDSTFTLALATTVSWPFVRSDGTDLYGDPSQPMFDFEAAFDGAWCDNCMQPVDEVTLHRLAGFPQEDDHEEQ